MEATQTKSLFDRIGGMSAVNAAVDIFYANVIADDRVNHFFRHIDIQKQSGKLKAFMAFAFGAPLPYAGKSLRDAHQHMHLTELHFNAVTEDLVKTLQELNIGQSLIDEVVRVVMTTRDEVLNI